MEQQRQVVFRRVKGRVVPIRISEKQKKNAISGGSLIASGVAMNYAAGKAYRAVNRISTAGSSRAFKSLERIMNRGGPSQGSFFSMMARRKAAKKATDALARSRKIGSFAAPLRIGGRIGGAVLIGAGAAKVAASANRDISVEQAGAVGAAFGTTAFLAGGYGLAAVRLKVKPSYVKAYPYIRKLKGAFKL